MWSEDCLGCLRISRFTRIMNCVVIEVAVRSVASVGNCVGDLPFSLILVGLEIVTLDCAEVVPCDCLVETLVVDDCPDLFSAPLSYPDPDFCCLYPYIQEICYCLIFEKMSMLPVTSQSCSFPSLRQSWARTSVGRRRRKIEQI